MHLDRLRRREFIVALGCAAAAWPLEARAQQPDRVRRVGVLMNLAVGDPEGEARIAAFVQALQRLGWSEGRNLRIDHRWAAGEAGRFHRYAEELLALAPDVILAAAAPRFKHCSRRPARCLSYSRLSPTRLALVSSTAWRARAATPPALLRSNTA